MIPRISNWQEVERRLANLIQTTKSNNTTITKTNNSLNSFLSSLAINLKDLLSSQVIFHSGFLTRTSQHY